LSQDISMRRIFHFDAKEGSKSRSIVDNFLKVAMESSKEAYALGNKYGAVNMNMAEIYNSYIISDINASNIVST